MFFRAIVLVTATVPSILWADEARTYEHRLGDHIVDYPIDAPEVLDSEMDRFGGQSFIKVSATGGTEVALTFRRPSRTLHYIEHDWIKRTAPASTAFALPDVSEFQFGTSKIGDVQKALGADGFHYACRQILPNAGGFLSFLSFEIPSRPDAVYTFVFEHSPDLAKLGLVDATRDDLEAAVLVATAVFRPRPTLTTFGVLSESRTTPTLNCHRRQSNKASRTFCHVVGCRSIRIHGLS